MIGEDVGIGRGLKFSLEFGLRVYLSDMFDVIFIGRQLTVTALNSN